MGFTNVVGVEPSEAPIEAAKPAIRGYLRCGIFAADQFAAESLDLITCFQVIEHVWDPVKITCDALALLKPGGLFLIVAHNRRAFSARIMGTKSPIFDIEHLQLFDKPTGAALLRNAGFESIKVSSVRNRYPVDYWIKLFPLPRPAKSTVRRLAKTSGIGNLLLSLPAGNLSRGGTKARYHQPESKHHPDPHALQARYNPGSRRLRIRAGTHSRLEPARQTKAERPSPPAEVANSTPWTRFAASGAAAEGS